MTDLDRMAEQLATASGSAGALADAGTAHLVVAGSTALSGREVPGVHIATRQSGDWLEATVTVAAAARPRRPVHLCFGMLGSRGAQRIRLALTVGPGAQVDFLSHCLFAAVELGLHRMEAEVRVERGGRLTYTEGHFHGPYGGIEVLPTTRVQLAPQARYLSDFSLTAGRVGRLATHIRVQGEAHSLAELRSRVLGRGEDSIELADHVLLTGEGARSLVRTRVVVTEHARARVLSTTEGNAAGTRGHMDCLELVRDQAVAESVPTVKVGHPQAKITHEAAIGTVDQSQLEALMARGLTPEEAVDLIVRGVLQT
jgi:Fe-S cluster assembly scaffold protein SufB